MYTFSTVSELIDLCKEKKMKISEIMLELEAQKGFLSKNQIIKEMENRLTVMKKSAAKGKKGVKSHSGMTGGDSKKLQNYLDYNKQITDKFFVTSIMNAIAINEVNASMGIICATPTAGSAGVLPGVLLSLQEKYDYKDSQIINGLLVAGAFGYIIANNAFVSGAAGGCQAEIGSAAAMTAAAITEIQGGIPEQSANAMAIALKNMLGLTCDPVAGLVEVPCIKRNAAGAAIAITAAEMALAGINTVIPWDEVIDAMYRIGTMIHVSLRETSLGGLASSPTGKLWKNKTINK